MRLYKQSGTGVPERAFRVIKNSEVIKVGDAIVDESTGMANVDAVTEPVAGIAVAIVNSSKVSLESATVGSGDYTGTFVAATKQFTAAADNETVSKVMVEYVPVREGTQFIATLSAAKGSTTGSNVAGYFIAVSTSDSSKLNETTASTSATNTQARIVDPLLGGSTTEVVVEFTLRGNE